MKDDGSCSWCDGPTRQKRRRRGGKPKGVHGRMTPDQVRAAHRLYVKEGLSCRELGRLLWERFGYASPVSAGESIYRAFKAMDLPRRTQREVTIARNLKHGRKTRAQTNEEQNAYRRWLAEQRGWKRVQGPGRPDCMAVKTGARGGKGEPCTRAAMEGSDYCYSHDPLHDLERQAALARARRRMAPRETVELEPFAAWVEQLYGDLKTLEAVAERLDCSKSAASNIIRRRRSSPDGHRQPWEQISRSRVERYLELAAGPSINELYPATRQAVAA